ncbi:ABC transporter ATP-binding protein [Nonomuraea endophytica]|uniref:Fatty acid ABC transporter ATP-binding/permease protein n=1 Tax=Nonomuraea endophytica TaxID=714136 RepID=A0A7W8EM08_9ACTN|nr:ABC transporter ATP-binding protein [Nonomuraea endophytica]MBB5084161.1 ATP-binding cassette subfamily B protein [Nonomuraea endophytica]
MSFGKTAWRLLTLLRPLRPLWGVGVLGLASIVLNVTGPLLLGRATDLVVTGAITRPEQGIDGRALSLTLLSALAVYAGSATFWILQRRYTTRLVQGVIFHLRREVEEKLGRLPVPYFDRQPRGEVLSRTTNDVDNLAQSMQQSIGQITNSTFLIAGTLGMMFWISPLLAAVALVTVPLSVQLTRVAGRRAQVEFARQWQATGELNAHVEEAYTGHTLITAYGRGEESAESFREHNTRLYHSSARAQFVSGIIGPATGLAGNLGYVLVAVVGGLQLAAGGLTVGAVQAFIQYSREFGGPLTALAGLAGVIQSGVASGARVLDLLDAEEEPPDPPGTAAPTRGRVVFDTVSFSYGPATPNPSRPAVREPERVIRDLSLVVEPGSTVAVVGPTGAGKTTLVNLLMRFYDVTDGRITVDGVDIRDTRRDTLRAATGMVPQDNWLFGGTIRDNIAYGRTGATAADVEAAARAAHADHFIRTLSHGYDTVIDQDGGALSAGERQLITIARAVLADPVILVLDEATSSVDTRTELLIQQALTRARRNRTSFVIAHRLSTIRQADLILMLQDGTITEQGTHEELLAANGPYAALHTHPTP